MNILHLITGLGQGGAEQIVLDLARGLDRERHKISVCSILDVSGAYGVYAARLRELGVDVLSLGLTRKWQIRRALALENVLRDLKPDVLHCHMFHANVLGRWAGNRVGLPHIIATVHIAERRWRPWRFWLERRTDPLGSVTVCVSHSVLEFHARRTRVPRDRFVVVPNGIDTARFAEPGRAPAELRRELGIGPGSKVIGSVGRLDEQKGHRYLIDAFGKMAGERADVELVIAGDGPQRHKLERLAGRTGCSARIHLIGRRPDVPDLLHAFDVFALASVYEGLPLALIEAMAAGVPVVASAVDSVPEVLVAGRLVPPRDPERLAEALLDALDHSDPEQTRRAQEHAREHHDVSTMVAGYAELYDSLAAGSASG